MTYHNIIGVKEPPSLDFGKKNPPSDGVVQVESARTPDASSEIQVSSEHSIVHQDAVTILEVRRILTEHLANGKRSTQDYDREELPRNQ